jgi:hypothetical protein
VSDLKRYDVELPNGIIHAIEAPSAKEAAEWAAQLNPRLAEGHRTEDFRPTESENQEFTAETHPDPNKPYQEPGEIEYLDHPPGGDIG